MTVLILAAAALLLMLGYALATIRPQEGDEE